MKNSIFIFLILLIFTGCKKAEITYDSITKCQWIVEELKFNGENYKYNNSAEEEPLLVFIDSTHVAGYAGCNRYMGRYSMSTDSVKINIIGTTRMLCSEEVMEKECKYIDAISGALKAQLSSDGQQLTLKNSSNDAKVTFKRGENIETPTPKCLK
ncbi:MAG: META domain-containing protein [Bacteroidales bacterium]|nr:META domain-containing protein [Bacteroidales bacterium]